MRRDQKLAKKKKAREQARTAARVDTGISPAKAATKPFGPCWMSRSWRSEELPPAYVSVLITRDLGTRYLAHLMLVDRTCFGIKNAFTIGPMSHDALLDIVQRMSASHSDGVETVDVEDAQSVVFAALAYAEKLGFGPDRDFDARLVGPAPSPLRPTPLAARERPFYAPGANDDLERTLTTLRRAVGEDGFDVGAAEQAGAGEGEGDEKSEDEQAISDAVAATFRALAPNGPPQDWEDALGELRDALGLDDDEELPPEYQTSLPSIWAFLFRPRRDGLRGVDHMRRRRPNDAAIAALANTRAVLFEVVAVADGIATCRDLTSGKAEGEPLRIRLGRMVAKATRWMRFFAYVTPMADGTYYTPSTMLGNPGLRDIPPETWLAAVNERLANLAIEERVDPKNPSRGLTRWAALADVVLLEMIKPTDEQRELETAPIYVVDSDGDRFEMHEASFPVVPGLIEALEKADDFVSKDGFAWKRGTNGNAGFVELPENGAIRVTTTSVPKFEELCARLEALAGAKVVPTEVKLMRPWEQMPRAVEVETPDARRVVFGTSTVDSARDTDLDMHGLLVDTIRRGLDEQVPMLGGKPRDLVSDEKGRESVERWLQEQELRGIPNSDEAFLDLDVLRRELRLSVVASEK